MKTLLGVMTGVLIFSSIAMAAEPQNDIYPSLSDIPRPLQMIGNSDAQFPERYVSNVLMVIRQNGRDKKTLDQQDIDNAKTKRLDEKKRQAVQQNIKHDLNMDGRISRDEVTQSISKAHAEHQMENFDPERESKQVDVIMKQDTDGDGFITLKEIGDFVVKDKEQNSNYYGGRFNDISELLALDPDKDGKLTIDELEALVRKAFRTIDADSDGIISREELKPLQEIARQNSEVTSRLRPECKLPAPGADEKIVYIGVYEGKAVSTISVAGQVSDTDVIPLIIENGSSKLYIVASSFSPVIWKITGATERISHVVLAGRSMKEGTDNNDAGDSDGKINVGATGVAADKITFVRARHCGMLSGYEQRPEMQLVLKKVLEKILGRTPDLMTSEYGLSALGVSDDRLNTGVAAELEQAQRQTPKGFDPETWSHHLRYMPGGVVDLKGEKIVSDMPAIAYEVLPKWAGISKLINDGALIPGSKTQQSMVVKSANGDETTITGVENIDLGSSGAKVQLVTQSSGYTIVKNIPYYPTGLYGGYSTQFTIKKGVKPPKGNAGHSTVVCESNGQTLFKPGMSGNSGASCD